MVDRNELVINVRRLDPKEAGLAWLIFSICKNISILERVSPQEVLYGVVHCTCLAVVVGPAGALGTRCGTPRGVACGQVGSRSAVEMNDISVPVEMGTGRRSSYLLRHSRQERKV